MLHPWCQWEKKHPILGVSEENCLIIGVSGRNSSLSLVSLGGIVPHHWYQWEE
ncbi:unnamed protein product [Staurois parvus]|uniref:Uncharacterized protein n=1 Tax=Staurois parvus TaxID=386267 RepID=A0ABN9C4F8_9NEOB|nr:unnamed protein product [Staurois parvus]